MPLLNTADAVYAGDTLADAVYVGSTKVWPEDTGGGGGTYLGRWEHQGITGATSIVGGMMGAQTNNAYFDINQADYDDDNTVGRFYVGQVLDIDGNQVTVTFRGFGGGREQLTFAEFTPHELSNLLVTLAVYPIYDIT